MTEETAAIKPIADAARNAAKARFDRIKADPAYRAAVNDSDVRIGGDSPIADRFVKTHVINGNRAGVMQMRSNLADSPVALQTMGAAVVDHLKAAAKADPETGIFRQSSYNTALTNLSPKLGALVDPVTAQQLKQLGAVAKDVEAQPRGSFVNNSNSAVAAVSKTIGEAAVNMLAGGLPVGSALRAGNQIYGAVKNQRAANAANVPYAGVTKLNTFP